MFRKIFSSHEAAERRFYMQPGNYRHFKGGRYELLFTAKHSETLEKMAVYRSLENGAVWVRPAHMWNDTVTVNGKPVKRFEKEI